MTNFLIEGMVLVPSNAFCNELKGIWWSLLTFSKNGAKESGVFSSSTHSTFADVLPVGEVGSVEMLGKVEHPEIMLTKLKIKKIMSQRGG